MPAAIIWNHSHTTYDACVRMSRGDLGNPYDAILSAFEDSSLRTSYIKVCFGHSARRLCFHAFMSQIRILPLTTSLAPKNANGKEMGWWLGRKPYDSKGLPLFFCFVLQYPIGCFSMPYQEQGCHVHFPCTVLRKSLSKGQGRGCGARQSNIKGGHWRRRRSWSMVQ